MSLKHLQAWSDAAAPSGAPDSKNFAAGSVPKAGQPMPNVPGVSAYSKEALHAVGTNKAVKHPFGGVRRGAKSGQPKLGKKLSGVLNTVHPNPNGGRAGAK